MESEPAVHTVQTLTRAPYNMVCPLRFILVGLSAIVATIGLYQTFWAEDEHVAHGRRSTGKLKRAAREPLLTRIWSFFNGRYLYENWKIARKQYVPGDDHTACDSVAHGRAGSM